LSGPAVRPPSVREQVIELLRQRGMTTIFGNPGSTELGMLAQLPGEFRYVMALHESVAVAMADGFAQATGRPAFVNLHSACGVGNAMGAVVNALHNRAPLVICGGNQDRRQLAIEPYLFARGAELMAPYVKRAEQPARAQDVPAAIARACALAQTPPCGPAFVSVPADDWQAPAEIAWQARPGGPVRSGAAPDERALAELAELISRARAVALIVGAGVDRSGAWTEAVALAERLCARVWTAPQSPRIGFPEDHPLYRGHLAAGYASAAAQLAGASLALVVGAPVFAFLPHEPGPEEMPEIALVTDDPDEAARAPARLSLIGDAREALSRLIPLIAGRGGGEVARAVDPASAPPPIPAGEPPSIPPAVLMSELGRALPADAVLVEEAPSHRGELRRRVRIRRPASFFASASGGLGFAMPAAVGIALAWPQRPVVCLVGDGSALFAPQALWSAVQLRARVAFVVSDNARYAILESVARFGGLDGVPSLELPGIDLVAMAASYGCPAERVEDPQRLPVALREAIAAPGPTLLDVAVQRDVAPLLG